MDADTKSCSASVSPPTPDTPDTPVQRGPTAVGASFDVGSPEPLAGIAVNMQDALDAAATEAPEEAPVTPAVPYEKTLWDILGIPPPAVTASQHLCTRVVLVGRALSGKRTLCRRLCVAAERQYPSTLAADEDEGRRPHAGDLDDDNRGLYWPTEDGDDLEETEEWPEADPGNRLHQGTNHRTHLEEVPHGAGISHDYVIQRLPRPVTDPKTGLQRTHRAVEFFCCDSAGALAMAIPTLESLETVVVCHVVDVSQPCSIEEQLNNTFRMVQAHIASVLRTYLPQQDEVRRTQMMEKVEAFWLREEQRLRGQRAVVQARSEDETLVALKVNLDEVNREALRLPQGTAAVSPVKAIIVCTKADVLEHLSKACVTADTPLTEEERTLVDVLVPEGMRQAMQIMDCTLPQLVAQLIRHYAVHHRCALAAVSSRVNTMSAPAAGEQIPLVNPLYRALWEYVCYLHQAGPDSATAKKPLVASSLEPEQGGAAAESAGDGVGGWMQACTANLYPCAFLPCGLDALGLLNEFVASEQVSLPATDPMGPKTPPPEWDHAAALKGCALDNGFHTHQAHLQGVYAEACGRDYSVSGAPDIPDWTRRAVAAMSGRSDGVHERSDEPMIWDTL